MYFVSIVLYRFLVRVGHFTHIIYIVLTTTKTEKKNIYNIYFS